MERLNCTSYIPDNMNRKYGIGLMLYVGILMCVCTFSVNAQTAPTGFTPTLNPTRIFTPIPRFIDPQTYTAKFVCGPQTLAATRIGEITQYSALQPGNYATAVNILTLATGQPIMVYASMDGVDPNQLVAQLPISRAFETHTVTCTEILNSLGVNVGQEAYEGFVYITRRQIDLDVQMVYTFAAKDRLGLGASIDVERIKPINRNNLQSN